MKQLNFLSLIALILFAGFSLSSCDPKTPDDPNAGKTDPSTIAASSLVAYFPFDADGVDKISSLTPAEKIGVTYVKGRRNNCYQGAENAYLLYNLGTSKLATMTNGFTVSAWVKNPKVFGDPVPMIFQIGKTSDRFWGNLTWMQERAGNAVDGANIDSLYYKFNFQAGNDSRWAADNSWKKFTADTWQYLTLSYNGSTSQFSVYVNGILYAERSKIFKNNETNILAGNLTFKEADKMVVGGWLTKVIDNATDVWMGWYKGNMDELRIYNAGLSASEAKALYDAEVTQIN
ncbi:MAG: LamG-like jellyroll fold domain-containing protein [Paludibacter sp.]|nr:LamG-like jellyroll fold domain-containing protein [Paludibacter sp.]